MDTLDVIKSRRTVREFTDKTVTEEQLNEILEAARWAPSGLNNQPWKLKVIEDEDSKKKLAECTKYGSIILGAPLSIAVFLDNNQAYDRTKDVQSMGACIQNMLLAIHSIGLGAVWLGEILNQREQAEKNMGVPEGYELMAVLSIGNPIESKRSSSRKNLDEIIF